MESLGKDPIKILNSKKPVKLFLEDMGQQHSTHIFNYYIRNTKYLRNIILNSENKYDSLAYSQGVTQARLLSEGATTLLKDEEIINGNVPVNLLFLIVLMQKN